MANINDILSDSIDFLNITIENHINHIKRLDNLFHTTATLFMALTFLLGYVFVPLVNGSEAKIRVICGYIIILCTEIYILATINFLRNKARYDALKLIEIFESLKDNSDYSG